jgi:hypothetical protein
MLDAKIFKHASKHQRMGWRILGEREEDSSIMATTTTPTVAVVKDFVGRVVADERKTKKKRKGRHGLDTVIMGELRTT